MTIIDIQHRKGIFGQNPKMELNPKQEGRGHLNILLLQIIIKYRKQITNNIKLHLHTKRSKERSTLRAPHSNHENLQR